MKKIILLLAIITVCCCTVSALSPSDYTGNVSFHYNITAGMGDQTNYQVKFILSNASGVSGYYAPYNVIYTNGSTRVDWYDVNVTDGSGNPVPFWVENNTATAYNVSVWVKVPSITVDNTSTGIWYFGNSTQSASTANGYATFEDGSFDDFSVTSLNTTQWKYTVPGSPLFVTGGISFNDTAYADSGIRSLTQFPVNRTFESYGRFTVGTSMRYSIGFIGQPSYIANATANNTVYYGTDTSRSVIAKYTGSNITTIGAGSPATVYDVYSIKRNGGSQVSYYSSSGNFTTFTETNTTYIPTGSLNITLGTAVNKASGATNVLSWVFVRKSVQTEPITSLYEAYTPTTEPLISDFTSNVTSGNTPLSVQFNDTTTGTPTGWAWFFGDEPFTNPWNRTLSSSGWTGTYRYEHQSLTTKTGKTLLIAGSDGATEYNDTWVTTDNGLSWTRTAISGGYTARKCHQVSVTGDNSLILTGGADNNDDRAMTNDTWLSADDGSTWTLKNASSGWPSRYGHATVGLSNGDIVLMSGIRWPTGQNETYLNDTWRSTDNGATWVRANSSGLNATWEARHFPQVVSLSDDTIVLTGGFASDKYYFYDQIGYRNDTWISEDEGETWTLINASGGWSARTQHSLAVMPDDTLVLTGGWWNSTSGARGSLNDTWISKNRGATWELVNSSPGWETRTRHMTAATAQGSLILTGGFHAADPAPAFANYGDTWVMNPVGASTETPTHTYSLDGLYTVALRVSKSLSMNDTVKSDYITATTFAEINASFSQTPNPSMVDQEVQFNDTSAGSPTTWNWTFGDGNTSTDQNPTNTFPSLGTYMVYLNVTNVSGSWSNNSATHTVANASAFTPQDVWMEGQYNITFHVTSSSDGTPLAATYITSDGQSGTASTLGYAFVTEGFGIYTITVSKEDYNTKTVSFVVDEDDTIEIQLSPSTGGVPYIVKYPPKDVRFHAQTLSGAPIPLVWVTATPYHTPLGSYEYVATLFGYDLDAVPLDSMELNGSTDSRGDITFAMMTDTQYYITAAKTGYTFQPLNITPHDDNYLLTADYTGSLFVTNGTSPAASVTFDTDYTRINMTAAVINLSVVDTSGVVTGGTFNITRRNTTSYNDTTPVQFASETFTGNQSTANFTLIDATVAGCPSSTSAIYNSTGSVVGCFNQTLVDDSSYQTGCKANTPSGPVYEVGVVWFKKMSTPINGLSSEFALFIALSIMMFTALMAGGPSSAPPMSIVVCFEGWIFYGLNMFFLLEGVTKSGMPIVPVVLTVMTFIAILWNFTEYRRKNK